MDTPTTIDHAPTAWHARGLLFENCNCQLVCPGHVHFNQLCTHEKCLGYWAMRFDAGTFGSTPLGGVNALVAFETPQHMIAGGWTEVVIIDGRASAEQRQGVEKILTGQVGGPWAVLGRFVSRRLDTRFMPVHFTEEGPTKRAIIPGLLDATVTPIRGRDRSNPVLFENIFNQIHAPRQVLATGDTRYDDGVIVIETHGTHGLYSSFEWIVEAS